MIRVDFLFREDIKSAVIIAPEKYASSTVMSTKKMIVFIVIVPQRDQTLKSVSHQEIFLCKAFCNSRKKAVAGCVCGWGRWETWCLRCLETAAHFPDSDSNLRLRFNEYLEVMLAIKWNVMTS